MDQTFEKQIEELLKNARMADRIDRERIEEFEKLIRTPGWNTYQDLLNAKIQMMADELLRPAGSVDGCVALEFVKGAMSGLVMARDIPAVTIAVKDQLRTQPVDGEMDDDDE